MIKKTDFKELVELENFFEKAIAQAELRGRVEELNRQIKLRDDEIKDIYETGRGEEQARAEKQNKKIVTEWSEMRDKLNNSFRSQELIAKQERERCVKAIGKLNIYSIDEPASLCNYSFIRRKEAIDSIKNLK